MREPHAWGRTNFACFDISFLLLQGRWVYRNSNGAAFHGTNAPT